jgi:hypothetical protein
MERERGLNERHSDTLSLCVGDFFTRSAGGLEARESGGQAALLRALASLRAWARHERLGSAFAGLGVVLSLSVVAGGLARRRLVREPARAAGCWMPCSVGRV